MYFNQESNEWRRSLEAGYEADDWTLSGEVSLNKKLLPFILGVHIDSELVSLNLWLVQIHVQFTRWK